MQTLVIDYFLRPLCLLICKLLFRIRFFGIENVPMTGSIILAPNHVSYADPFWVTIPLQRRVHYMAWDQIFRLPIVGWIMRFLGAFPVKIDRFDRSALHDASDVLGSGEALMIFPEGGRTVDGYLQPFKPGASRLALTVGTQIVPVTINGGYSAWPSRNIFPRAGKVTVTYHPPIEVPDMSKAQPTEVRAAAHELSKRIRAVIASSLDSQYLPKDQKENVLSSEF
ncbi:MAG TPA: lysophospholipid acyltransferase family protein [Blastocatellia bacterium]|nr:lysophospholipid acyltransferase family protein [Blastocatellia bacterium]